MCVNFVMDYRKQNYSLRRCKKEPEISVMGANICRLWPQIRGGLNKQVIVQYETYLDESPVLP